ncbi:MAG: hypothetical protein WC994_02135 [Brumimicrobium sp.]
MMKFVFRHIDKVKNVFSILFVFTALLPCSVKGFTLDFVDVTYEKPVHPTKSTFTQQSCIDFEHVETLTSQSNSSFDFFVPILKIQGLNAYFVENPSQIEKECTTELPWVVLPKYILFQRLKVALV